MLPPLTHSATTAERGSVLFPRKVPEISFRAEKRLRLRAGLQDDYADKTKCDISISQTPQHQFALHVPRLCAQKRHGATLPLPVLTTLWERPVIQEILPPALPRVP